MEYDVDSKAVCATWDELCKEYEIVRGRQRAAMTAVVSKFARVADRTGANPTDEELEEFEKSTGALEEIQKRMDQFVKANT